MPLGSLVNLHSAALLRVRHVRVSYSCGRPNELGGATVFDFPTHPG
jgi:hypothetical protein